MNPPVQPKKSLWPMLGVVVLTLLIISPIDAIPDAIPVLGWLDDLGYGILDIILLLYIQHRKKLDAAPGPVLDPDKKID